MRIIVKFGGYEMKMTHDEEIILLKVCRDIGLDPNVLKHIFMTEEQHFFSNESKQNVIINEILKNIEYWAAKEKGESV
jgi:hypothetical protein